MLIKIRPHSVRIFGHENSDVYHLPYKALFLNVLPKKKEERKIRRFHSAGGDDSTHPVRLFRRSYYLSLGTGADQNFFYKKLL
jgi:hypothetical protein